MQIFQLLISFINKKITFINPNLIRNVSKLYLPLLTADTSFLIFLFFLKVKILPLASNTDDSFSLNDKLTLFIFKKNVCQLLKSKQA